MFKSVNDFNMMKWEYISYIRKTYK